MVIGISIVGAPRERLRRTRVCIGPLSVAASRYVRPPPLVADPVERQAPARSCRSAPEMRREGRERNRRQVLLVSSIGRPRMLKGPDQDRFCGATYRVAVT